MDFTRQPLVETVITPKEGFKLIIRAINSTTQEEYAVGAIEVVSFGNCYFFRSLEKPKVFLLPMTGYEVVESRETQAVLKKPQIEKSIKISGSKKTIGKKDESKEEKEEAPKKHEKKRLRKKRSSKDEKVEASGNEERVLNEKIKEEVLQQRRVLLPPPTSLISDQIDRYKNYLVEQGALLPEEMEDIEDKAEEIPQVEESSSSSKENGSDEKVTDFNQEVHAPFEGKES
ncbi:MAG: hypothetical protein AAGE99_01885 [Chlamydiota bacterium]